jgi:type I restriction-modification system DNA methylase subunit
MSLFQLSVSSKYLKTLDKQAVQTAYLKFKAHFHNPAIQENIRNSKEEQYQEGFLNDLFVNVLGYTINPAENYNLTTEYKNVKDSKKADGAIVVGGAVKAVIELKGTNVTDLGQVEVQAFSYKNNQPECVYVITSNFEKLRFYIDNAIENLEFNLFTLSEKDFELLYLCLAYSQIEKGIPKKIKDESISHEDDITKQLYRDYSLFKQELHADLVEKNPEYDTLVLFHKSQKLLSRFLFLFFAEDRQLLPPNSVRLILNDWRDLQEREVEIALYDRFKKYFGYLNTGFKGKRYDVFAYNGGLFKPDTILDTVKIDDELLYRHTTKISDYDFASEVDVNILGHIFENSLNELDELKAEIAGETIDKSKTKRKKDGIFYTPKYITKYIIDNTVGRLCAEKKAEFGIKEEDYITDRKRTKTTKQPLAEKLVNYREWLLQITICDPACGSGAFLNQALNFLIDEHRYIDELQAKLFGDSLVISDIENTILENNLFGVDLNEESVEIAKLSLWLRTAQPNRKLNDLSNNIKCGNSLIDDPAVAGEKAFDWEREFPQVFGREPIADIVIVPEKEESPDYLKLIKEKSIEAQAKAEQGIALSKEALEISRQLVEYAEKLEAVSEPKAKYQIRKTGFDVVIGNPPYITFALGKNQDFDTKIIDFYKTNYPLSSVYKVSSYLIFIEKALKLIKSNGLLSFIVPNTFYTNFYYSNFRKNLIDNFSIKLLCNLDYEVFEDADTGGTSICVISNHKKGLTDLLSVKNETEFNFPTIAQLSQIEFLKLPDYKFLFSKNLISLWNKAFICSVPLSNNNFVIYNGIKTGDNNKFLASTLIDNSYKPVIRGRDFYKYTFLKSEIFVLFDKEQLWSNTNEKMFEVNEKLIFRQTSDHLVVTYDNNQNYTMDTTHILFDNSGNFNHKYLLAVLNSKLLNTLYQIIVPEIGKVFSEVKGVNLKKLPIKKISLSEQKPFIIKADQMLSLNKELQEVSGKFQRNLIREFSLKTLTTKLQNWHTLSYAEFIKELEKQKVKLTLHQKAEWETYFQQESDKARTIKAEIDSTDREIDQLVYQLYGLTEEEIRIVENS